MNISDNWMFSDQVVTVLVKKNEFYSCIGTEVMQKVISIQRSQDHLATPEVSQTHLAISTILIAQEKLLSRSILISVVTYMFSIILFQISYLL